MDSPVCQTLDFFVSLVIGQRLVGAPLRDGGLVVVGSGGRADLLVSISERGLGPLAVIASCRLGCGLRLMPLISQDRCLAVGRQRRVIRR